MIDKIIQKIKFSIKQKKDQKKDQKISNSKNEAFMRLKWVTEKDRVSF